MHVYKTVHGGEFNKNGNLNFTQLFDAWLQRLKRDLHGNENLTRTRNTYWIFWDGSINVIFRLLTAVVVGSSILGPFSVTTFEFSLLLFRLTSKAFPPSLLTRF